MPEHTFCDYLPARAAPPFISTIRHLAWTRTNYHGRTTNCRNEKVMITRLDQLARGEAIVPLRAPRLTNPGAKHGPLPRINAVAWSWPSCRARPSTWP